ncbi:MAG: hypothetical protein ACXVCY_03880 [Pseudobdellovibrionaceae bacterium]
MKSLVSALFIIVVTFGSIVQAEESVAPAYSDDSYVVEPIFKSNSWQCPHGTKNIAKYCWNGINNMYTRCGYVCQRTDYHPGLGHGHSPVPPMPH